jgi:uncharacterized protein (DUF983 family)
MATCSNCNKPLGIISFVNAEGKRVCAACNKLLPRRKIPKIAALLIFMGIIFAAIVFFLAVNGMSGNPTNLALLVFLFALTVVAQLSARAIIKSHNKKN